MSKKEDLEKKKKIQVLKQKDQEAAHAKATQDLKTKSTSQLVDEAEGRWEKSYGRKFTPQEKQDAIDEIETGKKYGDVSPLMSKGNFNRNSEKRWENTGITQDDADRIRKQKKR